MVMDLLNPVEQGGHNSATRFVVSSMMTMDLGFTVKQIIDARLVLLALLANFVAMPLSALVLDKLLKLDEPLRVGLLLLSAAASAPFLPKLTCLPRSTCPSPLASWYFRYARSVTCRYSCRSCSRES
jgi:BASS family bile acid:Na+ symporter